MRIKQALRGVVVWRFPELALVGKGTGSASGSSQMDSLCFFFIKVLQL